MCSDHTCEHRQRVQELEQEIAVLEAELEKYKKPPKDSSNSGTPPSLDPYRKYPEREKSNRSTGGQPGHKGHYRAVVETPDCVEPVYPQSCSHCGSEELTGLPDYQDICQEVDIPPLKPCVTEYRQHWAQCNRCGKRSKASFPSRLKATVQLGPQVNALTGYLKVCHHLSHVRIQQLLSDILGLSISQGSVENHLQRLANNLTGSIEAIRQTLRQTWLVLSDETRNRVNANNEYTWVFHTHTVCLFVSVKTRGYEVIEGVFGEDFPEVWVSDRYNAQLKVPCQHQLCLPHVVRNLQYPIDAEQSLWATSLQTLLRETMHFRKQEGNDYDPLETKTFRQIKQFESQLQLLFFHPPPQPEERKLFNGLLGRQTQLLYFLQDPNVPYDNNGSERALRNRVVHRKVSGGFRMAHGSQAYDAISSVIETAKRQKLNILNVLTGQCKLLCQGPE